MGGHTVSLRNQQATRRCVVNILLLSSGGGGGNILRSLKAMFRRDLIVTQKSDARYAERLRRSISTRFLDTNEFSLADVPKEERLIIGANTTRRQGSMHNPQLALQALEESRQDVESVLSRHSVVIIIGTGGKGTGAGTMFPLAQLARQQRKLVIPIFVRPSFERHEVEKRRYDHALRVAERFDAAGIRMMEILNDRGYIDANPEPQTVVWERMNLPIARALRGLLYVLWDLSQVDPSDLSSLFAGRGRLRVGFSELDPPAGREPDDDRIRAAVHGCWDNPYCAFDGPAGTSLVCIQGDWSNVVDGKIKAQLAALALRQSADSPYNPLYARALRAPRPWGVTTLFAEYTGSHPALDIDWSLEKRIPLRASVPSEIDDVLDEGADAANVASDDGDAAASNAAAPVVADTRVEVTRPSVAKVARPSPAEPAAASSFPTFWDFALAVNRSDAVALELAGNGDHRDIPIDDRELRRLLGTFWFRSVFSRLSSAWRERILTVLADHVVVPDRGVRMGRRIVHLHDMTPDERQRMVTDPDLPDAVRSDLQLLITVARLWGEDSLGRLEFTAAPEVAEGSTIAMLLQPFRHS
jgi:cell division GTPase FtsZ